MSGLSMMKNKLKTYVNIYGSLQLEEQKNS